MRIAILGFGDEGASLKNFLEHDPAYVGANIAILDKKDSDDYLDNLDQFDVIFRSPGVPFTLPKIQEAIAHGVTVSSATKLFFERCPREKIIGITGTKGKGSTASLLAAMLTACGFKTILAGNIGTPMLDTLADVATTDFVVLELSSFQLQDLTVSPHIAVVLDTFPDHLDVHKNMEEYINAKQNIARYQTTDDRIFTFTGTLSLMIANTSKGEKNKVSAPDTLEKNKVMAQTIAQHLGCAIETTERAAQTYRPAPHRLERVATVHGVTFINDSAGTSPQTAAMAIRTLAKEGPPIILIAGGHDKGLDYTPLAEAMSDTPLVKHVVLMGANREKIKQALHRIKNKELRITETESLGNAVIMAYELAQPIGATVLFSPAAASFDMFKNYKDRGDQFKVLVKKLETQ